jgi:hypothetical protein
MIQPPKRYPCKLQLLPGLKWEGSLRVQQRNGQGEFVVHFDARERNEGMFVYDCKTLTAAQLAYWTGVNPKDMPE